MIHSHMSICALDGDRSLRVVIDCEPLDKRLHICHFLNRRRLKIFSRNVLLSFYKRLVFNVLQVSVIHINFKLHLFKILSIIMLKFG